MSDSTLDELVDALLASAGQLTVILAHMQDSVATGRSAPDADPPIVVLRALLAGVLEARLAGRADLEPAARVVAEATEAVADEIFLVPFELPAEPARRPSRAERRRRRCA